MTTTRSIIADTERQARVIVKLARQCEAQGYFFALHGMNRDATNDYPFSFFVGGMGAYVDAWCAAHGYRYLRLNIFNYGSKGESFKLRIRRTRGLRPIVVALEMFGERRRNSDRYARQHVRPGVLDCVEASNYFEFNGRGRDLLETVVGVLNMPHHREILTRQVAKIK